MKKRAIAVGLTIIFCILAFGTMTLAANETSDSDKLDLAYKCLETQIDAKSSISLSEAIFGTLAIGSKTKLEDRINKEKRSGESCWPNSGCKIKESAQALLSYNKIGKDTKGIKDWLLSKSIVTRDLIWFLEIDTENHEASACTLKYDGKENKIQIKGDMTLEGTPGGCLEISYGGYWLKIKEACLEKEFEISCEKGFVTALVYQRKEGGAVFVSSETHSGAAGGTTPEKVSSKCFATSSKCEYEGTLWAALALKRIGEDISVYSPYLLALSEDNQKYLPSAFLYILTGGDDEYQGLVEKQKGEGYWGPVGSPYNRFYDTALGMLALSGKTEGDSAKNYLLKVQTKEGCWNNNNVQDTGFILYAWDGGRGGGGGGGGGTTPTCAEGGHYCVSKMNCLEEGGSVLDEFLCTNFADSCCSINAVEKTCNEKGGIVCTSNQECEGGTLMSSADGACCVKGACIEKTVENLCALNNGVCSSSCSDNEEKLEDACPDTNDVCCKEKEIVEEGGSYWIWVIIFGILILLAVIGIAYRRKIQNWFYSRKKGGERRSPRGMPPGMGPSPMTMNRPRYGPPGMRVPAKGGPAPRITRGVKSPEDEELEETMKKLREMSK